MKDQNEGLGGSYVIDQETGDRMLVERTDHDRHADAAAGRDANAPADSGAGESNTSTKEDDQ